MVAIVTGNGAGVLNSSASVIGGQGVFGNAETGTTRESVYVNVRNGNLVLQDQDEFLASRAVDLQLTRTYNSHGDFNDGLGEDWKLGLVKQVTGLTGTLNTAGSTITRIDSDGSSAIYTYDATKKTYMSTDGAGGYQHLSADANGIWTWTADRQDKTGAFEVYDSAKNGGRIQASGQNGDTLLMSYKYTADNRLASVTDASGEITVFHYDDNKRLSSVGLLLKDASKELVRTHYDYDDNGRLRTVTTDLTPEDGDVSDRNYKTTYQYDGTSSRIASISQSDGSTQRFTYELAGADFRIKTVSDGAGVTSFDYSVAGRTTVTDPMGIRSSYAYDDRGQLSAVIGPKVGNVGTGASFEYDAKGNVVSVTDGRGLKTVYRYDENGNRIYERDAAGNTLTRVYDLVSNQLLSESRYTNRDTDGDGAAAASAPVSTRYVYDAQNRLRFVVSAEGEVKEYRYNLLSQRSTALTYLQTRFGGTASRLAEADMLSWIARDVAADANVERTDFTYDARGQLRQSASHLTSQVNGDAAGAPVSVTQYSYDHAGQLVQTIDGNGNLTSYTYDGLGRILTSTDAAKQSTVVSYDDAHNTVITRQASGLVMTTVYDARGAKLSETASGAGGQLDATRYAYDAAGRLRQTISSDGLSSFVLYDAAGRKSAEIDASGFLTDYAYNADNQVTRSTQYAMAVDLASLADASGKWQEVLLEKIRPARLMNYDKDTWSNYDNAGRLSATLTTSGLSTKYVYDGRSNLTAMHESTVRSGIIITLNGVDAVAEIPFTNNDPDGRSTFYTYDADDRLTSVVDKDGYTTEYRYADSLLTETISYATKRATDMFGPKEALVQDEKKDVHTRNIYNARGLLAATVDGEHYLTRYEYDAAGNLVSKRRYATTPLSPTAASIDALQIRISADDQLTTYTYTALNQLQSETAPDGTVTRYSYDANGQVTEVRRAYGTTDERALLTRYDALGRVTAELSPRGAAVLATAVDQTVIAAVWATYGTTYTYNGAGLRLSMTEPGNARSLYYYDRSGNLIYTINPAGEVEARSYDAFGQVVGRRQFVQRLGASELAGLGGGQGDSAIEKVIARLASGGATAESIVYNVTGRSVSYSDASRYSTRYDYDAFGNVLSESQLNTAKTGYIPTSYQYDKRGNLTRTTPFANADLASAIAYDGFGRVVTELDANQHTVLTSYDRLGRVVAKQDGVHVPSSISYDAFNRVLTQTDSAGTGVVTYQYDTAGRSFSMTTAEGVVHTTSTDRLGQIVSVSDSSGKSTRYAYDKAGNLTSVTDNNGKLIEGHAYNADGTIASDVDANGVVTSYTYDAAKRVLTRTVDPVSLSNPAGLGLATTYTYNSAGKVATVTDPNGVVTETQYDEQNRAKSVVQDAKGLKRTTSYTYDSRGNIATVTDPNGVVTTSTESETGFGRVTVVGADSARESEQLIYDKTGLNVLVRSKGTDGSSVTRYAYNADNQLAYEIAPDGAVTAYDYDRNERLVKTTRFASRSSLVDAGTVSTAVFSAAQIAASITSNASQDQVRRIVYDKDGRVFATIDPTGVVTANLSFDADGRVTSQTTYAARLDKAGLAAVTDADTLRTQLAVLAGDADQRHLMYYDARGRLTSSLTAMEPAGNGQARWKLDYVRYDGNGNVTEHTTLAPVLALSPTAADIAGVMAANPVPVTSTRMVYDHAGRMIASAEFIGATFGGDGKVSGYSWSVTRQDYDNNGNVVRRSSILSPKQTTSPLIGDSDIAGYGSGTALPSSIVAYVYDSANRAIASATTLGVADASGAAPVYTWSVAANQYDAAGNLTGATSYAAALTAATVNKGTIDTFTAAQASNRANQVTRYFYDGENRVNLVAVAQRDDGAYIQWAVSRNEYDTNGRIVKQTGYAATFASNTLASGAVASTIGTWANGAADAGKDSVTRYGYDAAGHNTFVIAADGSVTGMQYDTRGNVTVRTQYAALDTGTNAIGAGYQPKTSDTGLDRVSRTLYDQDNRVLFGIDALGGVTQYDYDGLGRVIGMTRFAKPVTAPGAASDAAALDKMLDRADPANRSVTYRLDKQGRVQFTLDAAGYVTETRYDQAGRTAATVQYKTPVSFLTGETVAQQVAKQANAVTTSYEYDGLGNLTRETLSAADIPARFKAYGYDAQGRRTSFTNESGATWTYTYDLAGRMVQETAPVVNTYAGDSVVTTAALVTTIAYDQFGQVTRRTEADQTALARSTAYGYDLAGHQVLTRRDSTAVYLQSDPLSASGPAANLGSDSARAATATETASGARDTVVGYDAFGNALQSTDAASQVSRKLYDKLGRVAYEVDALGYVTGYERDAFGDVTRVTRYASTPGSSAYTSVAAMTNALAALDQSRNRSIETAYDQAGRATRTTEAAGLIYDPLGIGRTADTSASRITDTSYDIFGEVRAQASYGVDPAGTTVTEASEIRYSYDLRGNRSAEFQVLRQSARVDAKVGYVTAYQYDYANRLVGTVERAAETTGWNDAGVDNAGAMTGNDHGIAYAYDSAGNLVAETNRNVLHADTGASLSGTAGTVRSDVTTAYEYDKLGNRTAVIDALNGATYTFRDALGRITAVAHTQLDPATRKAVGRSQLTEYRLDILGNVTFSVERANGLSSLTTGAGQPQYVAASESADDRKTYYTYNTDGLVTQRIDAEHHASYTSYDVLGRVAKEWQIVTDAGTRDIAYQVSRYDAVGHLTDTITPGNLQAGQDISAIKPVHHIQAYNGFGEVTQRSVLDVASGKTTVYETSSYDNLGRAWRTNAGDGIDKVRLFDIQGRVTVQLVSGDTVNPHVLMSDAVGSAALAALQPHLMRTETRYDLLGHVVDVDLPDTRLMVLQRSSTGAWVKVPLDNAEPGSDTSLLIVAGSKDLGKTVNVSYRLQGSIAWTDAAAERIQTHDGYMVMNTTGLAGGNYDYRVTVDNVQNDVGVLTLAATRSTTAQARIIELYSVLLDAYPDQLALNQAVDRLNHGVSLAAIAADLLNSDAVRARLGGSAVNIVTRIFNDGFARTGAAGDSSYSADLNKWSTRFGATGIVYAAEPAGQAIVDMIAEVRTGTSTLSSLVNARARLSARTDVGVSYLAVNGGNDTKDAQALYAQATAASALPMDAAAKTALEKSVSDAALADRKRTIITQVFVALLRRPPEPAGMKYWLDNMNGSDAAMVAMVKNTLAGEEVRQFNLNAASDRDFVLALFGNMLGRSPSDAELATWTSRIQLRGRPQAVVDLIKGTASYQDQDPQLLADKQLFNVKVSVSLSFCRDLDPKQTQQYSGEVGRLLLNSLQPGATLQSALDAALASLKATVDVGAQVGPQAAIAAQAQQLQDLHLSIARAYILILGRAPDKGGLDYWSDVIWSKGASLAVAATYLATSPESKLKDLSNEDFVRTVFNTGIGRAPTSAELTQFTQRLNSGVSRGQVALDIGDAILNYRGTSTSELTLRTLLQNRTAVAETYATVMGGNNAGIAAEIIARVTKDDISAALSYGATSMATIITENITNNANAAVAAGKLELAAAEAVNQAIKAYQTIDTAGSGSAVSVAVMKVTQLYVGILMRSEPGYLAADFGGLSFYVSGILQGDSFENVAQHMLDSSEGKQLFPPEQSDADFIRQVYRQVLGRVSRDDEVAYWALQLKDGRGAVAARMIASALSDYYDDSNPGKTPELLARARFNEKVGIALASMDATAKSAIENARTALAAADALADGVAKAERDQGAAAGYLAGAGTELGFLLDLSRLYVGVLNRGPGRSLPMDINGLSYWLSAGHGNSLANIADMMIADKEGLSLYANAGSNTAFLAQLSQQILGRPAGATESAYLLQLDQGVSRGTVAAQMIADLGRLNTSDPVEQARRANFDQAVAAALKQVDPSAPGSPQQVQSALEAAAGNLAIAQESLRVLTEALNKAKAANVNDDPAVKAADAVANAARAVEGNEFLTDVVLLWTAFGVPVTYDKLVQALARFPAGASAEQKRVTLSSLASELVGPYEPSQRRTFIANLYQTILQRLPDAAGLDYWVSQNLGSNAGEIAYTFYNSALNELNGGIRIQRPDFASEVQNARLSINIAIGQAIQNVQTARTNAENAHASRLRGAQSAYQDASIAYQAAVSASNRAEGELIQATDAWTGAIHDTEAKLAAYNAAVQMQLNPTFNTVVANDPDVIAALNATNAAYNDISRYTNSANFFSVMQILTAFGQYSDSSVRYYTEMVDRGSYSLKSLQASLAYGDYSSPVGLFTSLYSQVLHRPTHLVNGEDEAVYWARVTAGFSRTDAISEFYDGALPELYNYQQLSAKISSNDSLFRSDFSNKLALYGYTSQAVQERISRQIAELPANVTRTYGEYSAAIQAAAARKAEAEVKMGAYGTASGRAESAKGEMNAALARRDAEAAFVPSNDPSVRDAENRAAMAQRIQDRNIDTLVSIMAAFKDNSPSIEKVSSLLDFTPQQIAATYVGQLNDSTRADMVRDLYARILNRTPDEGGMTYWVEMSRKFGNDAGAFAYEFYQGALRELSIVTALVPVVRATWGAERTTAMNYVMQLCNDVIGRANATRDQVNKTLTETVRAAQSNYDSALTRQTSAERDLLMRRLDAAILAENYIVTADESLLQAARATATLQALMGTLRVQTGVDLKATREDIVKEMDILVAQELALAHDATLASAQAQFASAQAAEAQAKQAIANAGFLGTQAIQVVQYYQVLAGRSPSIAEYSSAIVLLQIGGGLTGLIERVIRDNPQLYPQGMSNDAFVTLLYKNSLNRDFATDPNGLAYWTSKLTGTNPLTRAQLAGELLRSFVEPANLKDVYLHQKADTVLFQQKLGASLDELAKKFQKMSTNPEEYQLENAKALHTAERFAEANVATSQMAQDETALASLYIGLFGRAPDTAGFAFWLSAMKQGMSITQVAESMMRDSAEVRWNFPSTMSANEFVNRALLNIRGALGNVFDVAQYSTQLATQSRAQVILNILNDTRAYEGSSLAMETASTLLDSRVDAALRAIAADSGAFSGDVLKAQQVLQSIVAAHPVLHTVDQVASADLKVQGNHHDNVSSNKYEVDRWGNVLSIVDERNPNWKTTYTYDANNQLLSTTLPDAGQGANTTRIAYDELGRQVKSADARGNVNIASYDIDGNLTGEKRADGSTASYEYNAFGNRISSAQGYATSTYTPPPGSADGIRTAYAYDHLGHLTSSTSAPVTVYVATDYNGNNNVNDMRAIASTGMQIITTYAYDELGRQTAVSILSRKADKSELANVVTKTTQRYDLSGNVISNSNFDHATSTSFDEFNRMVWRQDATGAAMSWTYAADGRLDSHTELAGTVVQYSYTAAGQLRSETSNGIPGIRAGQDLIYTYDTITGKLVGIDDRTLNKKTTYAYDEAGNRVLEKTEQGGQVVQNQQIEFDAQSRIVAIHSDVAGADYDVEYTYDEAGNRKHVETSYTSDNGDRTEITEDNRFDGLNRQIGSSSVVSTWTRQTNNTNVDQQYEDTRGLKVVREEHTVKYDGIGNRVVEITSKDGKTFTDSYSYDAVGRLVRSTRDGKETGYRYYDAAGRVSGSLDNNQVTTFAYDQYGNLLRQRVSGIYNDYKYDIHYTNADGSAAYDKAGNLLAYYVIRGARSNTAWEKYYTMAYNKVGDSWKLGVEKLTNKAGKVANTIYAYDANGDLSSVDKGGEDKSFTTLFSDAQGKVLRRTVNNQVTHSLIVNDQLVGSSGDQSQTFSTSFEPLTSATMTASQSWYTVQAGDTLEGIAKALWGDASLWYLISNANGGVENAGLVVNDALVIPPRASTTRNDFQTFKAYDPSKAVGDTTPTLADPSSGGRCGGLGKALLIAVAVVATVYTAGAFAASAGSTFFETLAAGGSALTGAAGGLTFAEGALAGAAGSVASQAFGDLTGITDGFDWRGVALGALGGGFGAQINTYGVANPSSIFGGVNPGTVALRAASASALTQGAAVITGLQSSFNWRAVAGSAAGAGVGQAVGPTVNNAVADVFGRETAGRLVGATVTGTVAGVTTALFNGGKVDITRIAADAFGNALGQSLASANWGGGGDQSAMATDQGPKVYKNGTTLPDSELFGGETNWLRKMGMSNYAVPNTTADTGTWGQTLAQWREDNPTYIPQVLVQGQSWSAEQKLASWFPGSDSMSLNSTEQSRNFNQRYYNSQEASASNPVSAALWHVAGLTSDAAHNLEAAGRGVASLFTDGQARSAALNGLQQTWDHLPSVVIKGMQNFSQMSYGEQAGSLYKFGLENVATFGAGKVIGAAGGLAYEGGLSTAKWLAPKAGEFALSYAQRTGILLNAVEDTGIRTATQLRNTPGVSTASGDLLAASGRWLDPGVPTPIPAQVGDALVGRAFASFKDLRSAIWENIGTNAELNSGFSRQNVINMRNGLAPFAPPAFLNESGAFGQSFNLHHIQPISAGGAVYDLSNLRIVSPVVHYGIHY
jgi:YD repeat-containing protein